jgi:hypothetical protein
VFFDDAIQNVVAISRVLKAGHHPLLLGSQGKKVLAKMSAMALKMPMVDLVMEMPQDEWKKLVKPKLMDAAFANTPVALLLSGSLLEDQVIECLRSLMNEGEMVDFYDRNDELAIFVDSKTDGSRQLSSSRSIVLRRFAHRVANTLRVVMIGDQKLLRKLPWLVSSFEVVYLLPLPKEALV